MKTRDDDIVTVDPEDTAAAAAWATRRAAAVRQLAAAQTELAQIEDTLARDPAHALLAERDAARTATRDAKTAADDAAGRAESAHRAAADYAEQEVRPAQAALDAATNAVSLALADLLRQASATTAITATVDGLALRQRYLSGTATQPPTWNLTTVPFLAHPGDTPLDKDLALPAVGDTDYPDVIAVLAQLDSYVDAIADLVSAESVHQLVQGNMVRSGAALDLASTGGVPDSFDVVRTPQTGEVVTHRVLLFCDAAASPRWPVPTQPGSTADPILSAWATALLPNPETVSLRVSRLEPDTGQPGHAVDLTASDLGLDPLGIVRAAADSGELRQRIALVARRRWTAGIQQAALTGAVVIEPGDGIYRMEDLMAAAGAVRALLGQARAVTADDLTNPSAAPQDIPQQTVDAVTQRVAAVEARVQDAVTALESAAGLADPLRVADALLVASGWGVASATPQLDQALPGLPLLRSQADRAATELSHRLSTDPFEPVANDAAVTIRRARARISQLCGWQVPVLVGVATPTGPPWAPVFGGPPLAGAEPAHVRGWLDSYARVRGPVRALLDAYDLAEALQIGANRPAAATAVPSALDAAATQLLPSDPSDGIWHGADPDPPVALINVVVQRAFSGAPSATISGLAVDGWTQRTPSRQQQTAVAFHYDEPNSTPPQTVIVAVAPDVTPERQPDRWDVETLCETLLGTLALAKQRAAAAERTEIRGITVKEVP